MITVTFDKQKAAKVVSKTKNIGIFAIAGLWEAAQQTYAVAKVVSKEINKEIKK